MQEITQKRGDIQGLRAWAVLFVVFAHLAPGIFPGGFIGVDIFFVISGFVITTQMIKLRSEYPHSFLRNFYARRIRRILPSALAVILISYLATQYFLGIVVADDFKGDAGWVSVFLGNFRFQDLNLDYFAAGIEIIPLQHFWSLSIEEQFYLLWPAIFLLLGTSLFRAQSARMLIAFSTTASLFFSIYESEVSHSPIFFNSLARIWELGAGALIAFSPRRSEFSAARERVVLLLFILGGFFITAGMQWPGISALPIVAGTAYLLSRSNNTERSLLALKPFQYIGDLSYLIYLWHWPILVIAKNVRSDYGVMTIALIIALTAICTLLTHYLLEKPLRYSELLVRKPLVTIFLALSIIAITSTFFFTTYKG